MFHFTDGIDRTSQWIDPEKFLPHKKNLLCMQFDSSLRSQGQLFGVIYYRFWQVGRIAMTLILSAIANITESFPTSSSLFSSNQNLVQARWSLHKLEIKSQCRKEQLNENLRQMKSMDNNIWNAWHWTSGVVNTESFMPGSDEKHTLGLSNQFYELGEN